VRNSKRAMEDKEKHEYLVFIQEEKAKIDKAFEVCLNGCFHFSLITDNTLR